MVGVGVESSDGLVGVITVRFGDDGFGSYGDGEVSLFGGVSTEVGASVEGEISAVGRSGDGGEGQSSGRSQPSRRVQDKILHRFIKFRAGMRPTSNTLTPANIRKPALVNLKDNHRRISRP